jgi:hypothetical protein
MASVYDRLSGAGDTALLTEIRDLLKEQNQMLKTHLQKPVEDPDVTTFQEKSRGGKPGKFKP